MSVRYVLGALVSLLLACHDPTAEPVDAGPDTDARGDARSDDSGGLPIRHTADPSAAARGQPLLERGFGRGNIPALAIRNLWIAWGQSPPASDAAYWAAFRARYGLYEAPYDNGGYPMGLHAASGDMVTMTCTLCHATSIAGDVVVGAANSTLDLQALYDDLVTLNQRAPSYGYPTFPIPYTLVDATGAAGANDAFGLGMSLAQAQAPHPALHERYGYQRAPAWWTQRFRDRGYVDGAGEVGGHRTMMATLLAYGYSFAELQALDASFRDVAQAVLATPAPPAWSMTVLDPSRTARGRDIFASACARCHGTYGGPTAGYPDVVTSLAEVGTDPVRAASFTPAEAAWIDASWFGADHPMTATGGYLAPPLVRVWAAAPYFHDGSVPDLAGVLDSRARPAVWRRAGTARDDYDPVRVGWRYTTPAAPTTRTTAATRTIVDTQLPGMSNDGHTYGDALSDDERADLLEYLRSL